MTDATMEATESLIDYYRDIHRQAQEDLASEIQDNRNKTRALFLLKGAAENLLASLGCAIDQVGNECLRIDLKVNLDQACDELKAVDVILGIEVDRSNDDKDKEDD